MFSIFLGAMVLALIPASVAAYKRRSFAAFWIYGLILFPVALVHAVLMRRRDTPQEIEAKGRVPCPDCSERILPQANVCPFCRSDVRGRIALPAPDPFVTDGGQPSVFAWVLGFMAVVALIVMGAVLVELRR